MTTKANAFELPQADIHGFIAICTGIAAELWTENERDKSDRREFYRNDGSDQMVRLISDGQSWSLTTCYTEGGCIKRLAHGVHDGDQWHGLRASCAALSPLDADVMKPCCENLSTAAPQPRTDSSALPDDIPF